MTFIKKIIDILTIENWQPEDNVSKTQAANEKEQFLSMLQSKIYAVNALIDKVNLKPKSKRMSDYEIERYARECNAYDVKEERKEQNKERGLK